MVDAISVFHYTTKRHLDTIQNGRHNCQYDADSSSYKHTFDPSTGLKPCSALFPHTSYSWLKPDEIIRSVGCGLFPAVFALTEKEPDSWTKNKEFPEAWKILLCSIYEKNLQSDTFVLLKVDTIESDLVYVVDKAHALRASKTQPTNIHEAKSYFSKAYEMLWKGKTKLKDYDNSFSLPEVVIFNTIPKERIHLESEVNLVKLIGDAS